MDISENNSSFFEFIFQEKYMMKRILEGRKIL